MTDLHRRDVMLLAAASALAANTPFARADEQPIDMKTVMHGLKGVEIPKQMTVVGIGGSGCWPVLFAAFCGVEEMQLIDAGDVSADDMGRTCYRPSDIGKPKAEAIAEIAKIFRPSLKTKSEKRFVEPGENDVFFGTVIIDGTDYPPLNKALFEETSKRGLKFVQGFYNGINAGVTNKHFDDVKWKKGQDAPIWPAAAALCGVLQIYSTFVNPVSYIGDLSGSKTIEGDVAVALRGGDYAK